MSTLLSSASLRAAVQKTRTVGPDRAHERAADALAHQVLAAGPTRTRPSTFRARVRVETPEACSPAAVDREAPLPRDVRAWMEPRFGADFSGVRVHTGPLAAELCRVLGARAFTFGASVHYGDGLGPAIDELTAHELSHVLQQRGQPPVVAPQIQLWPWDSADRSPERDAVFARKDEFVDRLNRVAGSGLNFRWDTAGLVGNKAELKCIPAFTPTTRFQRFMKEYVERTDQVIPLRFVPGEDPDPADPQNQRHICEDSFFTSAVDLDDLMAADDIGFQAVLMHFLEERYCNARYMADILLQPPPLDARQDPNYRRAHQAAREKEAALFQHLFRDTTIRTPPLSFSPTTPNTPYVIVYPSNRGYSIVQRIERPWDAVARMVVWVVEGSAQAGVTIRAADYVTRRASNPPIAP